MKITVDVDITPDELRKLFGLPDVEAFQAQMMDELRKRMLSGAEGYDPLRLFQPYVSGTMASWDFFQKMMAGAMQTPAKGDPDRADRD